MGYYSKFNLTINGATPEAAAPIIEDFRNTNEYAEETLQEDGSTNGEGTWYECQDDLQEFSKKYPNVVFIMERNGEEFNDKERIAARNGDVISQTPEVTFPALPEEFQIN